MDLRKRFLQCGGVILHEKKFCKTRSSSNMSKNAPFLTETFIDYQGYTKFDTTDKEQEEGTIRCLLHFCFSTCVREIPLAPLLLPCVLQCVCRPSSGTMVLVLASTAQRDLGGNLPPTTLQPRRSSSNTEVPTNNCLDTLKIDVFFPTQ